MANSNGRAREGRLFWLWFVVLLAKDSVLLMTLVGVLAFCWLWLLAAQHGVHIQMPRTRLRRRVERFARGLPDLREVELAEQARAVDRSPAMRAYRRAAS